MYWLPTLMSIFLTTSVSGVLLQVSLQVTVMKLISMVALGYHDSHFVIQSTLVENCIRLRSLMPKRDEHVKRCNCT